MQGWGAGAARENSCAGTGAAWKKYGAEAAKKLHGSPALISCIRITKGEVKCKESSK